MDKVPMDISRFGFFEKSDTLKIITVHICLDYLFGSGLMEMFLWTVGSFYDFGEQVGFDLSFSIQSLFFEKTPISRLLARCKAASSAIGQRLSFF